MHKYIYQFVAGSVFIISMDEKVFQIQLELELDYEIYFN